MREELSMLLTGLEIREGALSDSLQSTQTELSVRLPQDYVEFTAESNGAEGFVGECYLVLWPIESIVFVTQGYRVSEFANGLLLFGSDGAGEGYAFEMTSLDHPDWSVRYDPGRERGFRLERAMCGRQG